nr:T9SS type A sorting domain-containing protein [uncultured Flavobacterium sp.]
MRKNYFYFILLFMCSLSIFSQKVTLTPTTVNGTNYSSGPINLASTPTSTISLGVVVQMPASPGDNGTLSIYYSNGVVSNVVSGGNSKSVYFGGGNSAPVSFVINLFWSDHPTSGQYLYAEYKTFSNVIYRSSNIPIIKNATMTTGTTLNPPADAPNPTKIVNTLCCNQTVRLGEKPQPIIGSTFLNPYQREPYGINSRWNYFGQLIELDNITQTLSIDYTTQLGTFTVERSLGYLYGGQFPNNSNKVTVTVVPSPIANNEINIIGSLNTDDSYEVSIYNPKDIFGNRSSINLNVLENPYYIPKRSDVNISIDKYEWEYRITNGSAEEYKWSTIPNQSSGSLNSSYIPQPNNSKDKLYHVRRIAIYQNLRFSSNIIKISLRTIRDNNTICCDQTLQVSSSNEIDIPSTITGPITMSDKNTYLLYQWQSQMITERGAKVSNWTNIPNATSQNYTPAKPEFIPGIGRNEPSVPTYKFRRIATDYIYNSETYYSNEVSMTPSINTSTSTLPLIVYPNPAISIINIEDTRIRKQLGEITLADINVTIVNIMGSVVNSNNFSLINPNLISIDVSNLPTGTYFINLTNASGRGFSQQFTFIKN